MNGSMAEPPRWAARSWRAVAVVAIAIYLAGVVMMSVAISSHLPPGGVAGIPIAAITLGGFGLSWWAVKRSTDPRTRSAWIWIAASCTMLALSGVLFNAFPGGSSFPRPGDDARLLVVPLLLTGLLRLPTRSGGSQVGRLKLVLDSGAVAVAATIFLWYFQVGPMVTAPGADLERILTATAYPLGDVIMVFGVAVVLTRGVSTASRRPMLLLAAAMVPWMAGDVYLGYSQGHADSRTGYAPGWELLAFLTAHFLLAAAAFVQCRPGAAPDRIVERVSVRKVSTLPYVAVASGFLLMLFVVAREHALYPWGGMVLCTTLLTGVVVARQIIAQRENHIMAVTDGLTGLANRTRLHQALSLALARGARSGHTTGVLLADLNGFKQINDTLGHEAGDKLLVAFGEMLCRSILGADVAGRLGGDEFAVVLHNISSPANAEAVVRRIIQEAANPVMAGDTVLQIRGSIGIALSGPGEVGLDELIRRADVAMYQAKTTSRTTGTSSFAHYDPADGNEIANPGLANPGLAHAVTPDRD
jgi:diguanylate cyclase (GGDEF)-like protein